MGKLAFLFPGQASQYPGMGKELADKFPAARSVFTEADEALGFSVSELCFAGSEEALKLTANTQPAILTVSVAACRVLEERGVRPDFVAGHSLGEYSAIVSAGGLKFEDAVRLLRHRGEYMQTAVAEGIGAMAAIMGLAPAQVAEICRKAADGQVVAPANLNSPEQTVISGHAAAVKRAVEMASRRAHAFVDDMKRRAVEPPTRGGIAGRMQALYQWARIWRNRALRPDVLRAIA